jgi:hypothetical protein
MFLTHIGCKGGKATMVLEDDGRLQWHLIDKTVACGSKGRTMRVVISSFPLGTSKDQAPVPLTIMIMALCVHERDYISLSFLPIISEIDFANVYP